MTSPQNQDTLTQQDRLELYETALAGTPDRVTFQQYAYLTADEREDEYEMMLRANGIDPASALS